MKSICIEIGGKTFRAELYNTKTSELIFKALPLKARFNTWGDEIYFPVPVEAPLDETATSEVALGDLGYWPEGNAMCIFFGKTPISRGDKIIPASQVNIVGRLLDDPRILVSLKLEKEITIYPEAKGD